MLHEGAIMRHPFLLLPLLFTAGAQAQTMPYPPRDTAPISSVQVSARAMPQRLKPEQRLKIAGAYEMSNGWYLRVRAGSRSIETRIDREPPLRLVAVAPNRFVSGDGNITMQFNLGASGDDMEMSYVPAGRLAQRVVLSSRLALR
jgi:hypothetical protein